MRPPVRFGALCIALLGYGAGPALGQENSEAAVLERRALDQATRLERSGRPDEALRVLESFLESRPTSVSSLLLLSQVAERSGEPERALARAERAVRLDETGLPAVRQVWIRSLQAAGLGDSALNVALRWIEETPREPAAHAEISALLARAGDRQGAIRALEDARAAIGSERLFVQDLAHLYSEEGAYAAAAAEWRAMLSWGDPGIDAVERRLTDPAMDRPAALAALRSRISASDATILERRGAVNLAMALAEFEWARTLAHDLTRDLPDPGAAELLRDYLRRARDAGDVQGAAWAAGSLAEYSRSEGQASYWLAVAAESAFEVGDMAAARRDYERLREQADLGSDLHEVAIRRLHEIAVAEDPDAAERLLSEHRAAYPAEAPAFVRMSVRSAERRLASGELERARELLGAVSPSGPEEAALRAAALGRLEILAGRPGAARSHLELAAAVSASDPAVRIGALDLLLLLDESDSASIQTAADALSRARRTVRHEEVVETVRRWSESEDPGGARLAAFMAQELESSGAEEPARSVRMALVEGWPDSALAPRVLLELARSEDGADPARAPAWLERLIVEFPESALAPVARRLLEKMRLEAGA